MTAIFVWFVSTNLGALVEQMLRETQNVNYIHPHKQRYPKVAERLTKERDRKAKIAEYPFEGG